MKKLRKSGVIAKAARYHFIIFTALCHIFDGVLDTGRDAIAIAETIV